MRMNDNIKKGNDGEQLAAEFLKAKGFTILERNYKYKRAEIDLIVSRENWLIFIEVKTRSSASYGHPEEFVDYHKEKMILWGALQYMYKINWQGNVRYDIVSILLRSSGPEIVHIEDAFY
jgi:putative endonuclease